MKSVRDILIASTVMPALLLAQCGAGAAQTYPGAMRMAQAPAGGAEPKRGEEPGHREEPGRGGQKAPGAAPAGGGAPHQAPAAPRAETPRAEPHAAPAAEPHRERAAPAAHEAEPARPAPTKEAPKPAAREREAEPARPAPAAKEAPKPAAKEREAEPARPTPAAPRTAAPAATPPAAAPATRATETPAERRQEREAHPVPPATPAAPPAVQRAAPAAQPAPTAAPTPAPTAARPAAPAGQPGQPHPQGQGDLGRPGQPGQAPARPQPGPVGGQPGSQPNGQFNNGQNNNGQFNNNRAGGISPGGAAAIGAAAGFAGGFLAATGARGIDDIRRDRREVNEDGVDYIREPGRTIVRDGDRSFVVHDENERFRDLGLGIRTERRGDDNVSIFDRPGGEQILTYTDGDGRMIRRVRRLRDGREFVLIDNGFDGRVRPYRDDVVVLPEEPLRIPRDRFIVDAADANETLLYDTLSAPPVAPINQHYTLDQVRYSPTLRARMRSVDVDSLNFDPGSWIVPQSQASKLQVIGEAIKRAVSRNANEVFLVEGYTDATGNPTDNLSLSDRRAQSVATILSRDFGVPPENLTTQGYGQQYLKEQTQGSSQVNRRVTLRRITPLIAAGNQQPR